MNKAKSAARGDLNQLNADEISKLKVFFENYLGWVMLSCPTR